MKRVASPGSMHDTGCLGLVHWDDPEGWNGEGGGRGVRDGEGTGTPIPVLLPGESHGQRSLVGCSPWGRTESDTTERLHFHFSLSYIGEGNGNPLQSSCLENPRDGGNWWAAVYRITQSRTRLKWLSSSSIRGFSWVWELLVNRE